VPTGTPAPAIKRLFDETAQALRLPEIGRALATQATEASGSDSPAAFAAFLAEDAKLWERVVKDSGVKTD
jgi:tripartite-type tricarboxylate transporter receptor subunit TctC